MEIGFGFYLGLYFGLGVVAIVVLDLCTGRVRKRLREASYETQNKLAISGSFVGAKTALILIIIAVWLFWPVLIYGAVKSSGQKESANGQKRP